MSNLLGAVLMFTCHQCKPLNLTFATWDDLVLHRSQGHPLDFVDGTPFWMLEQTLTARDYYWVARQIRDRPFLKWAGQRQA